MGQRATLPRSNTEAEVVDSSVRCPGGGARRSLIEPPRWKPLLRGPPHVAPVPGLTAKLGAGIARDESRLDKLMRGSARKP
jgi:hypothetical protein